MVTTTTASGVYATDPVLDHSYHHGLSWSAIIAGAFVTAALGLILIVLGVGLGLSTASPYLLRGVSTHRIAEGAIGWMVLAQIIAGGMGGYLAGRLRHRWMRVHAHEIYFRDSAQGFLAWAVAIVFTAAFLASASASLSAGSAITAAATPALSAPASGIAGSAAGSTLNSAIASDEGNTLEAQRKAVTYGALWLFIALLGGAFSSALFGTVGGRHRDTLFVYTA